MSSVARSIPSGSIPSSPVSGGLTRTSVAAAELAEVRRLYLLAQLSGDRREALRLVIERGIGGGASVFDVQFEVIQAAQQEIGRLWQENQISLLGVRA